MIKSKKRENTLMIVILIFSFAVTLYCQYPLLLNKYAIYDDVRQSIYTYFRYQDKELFKNDFITDFYYRKNPWGVNIFYFLISHCCDPINATKILPFFLCPLSALYLFKLGRLLKNNTTGFIAGFLFILVAWSRTTSATFGSGYGADFSRLFCNIFIYHFCKRDYWKMCIILILQSLFYPPVFLICLLAYIGFFLIDLLKGSKINKQKMIPLIGALFIGFSILLINYSSNRVVLASLKEMINMEEFYPGGRTPLFFSSIYERLTNYQSGLAFDPALAFLFFASLLILILLKKKVVKLPRQFWYFILASLILFIIATIIMYKLFGPSRYMKYSLPIFLIMFISLNIYKLLLTVKSKKPRLIVLLSLVLLTCVYFMPRLQRYYIVGDQPKLYSFLQSLPKDIYIAGHPVPMNNIPVFAKRKVLINEETSEPYYAGYYSIIKKRTYDFFNAYYSSSPKEIYDFCKKYNITHLIVYKSHFNDDYLANGQFYLNPFNAYIKNLVKGRDRFVLREVPQSEKIFEDGDIFVVKIENKTFWEQ